MTSRSRYSRTASTSSMTVGRSCTVSATSLAFSPTGRALRCDRRLVPRARVEELEQVPLLLRDPSAERGELNRAHEAVEVRERLHLADDAPLQRPEDLPEVEVRRVHGPPGCVGVHREQLFGGAEAARAPVDVAEPPRLHAEPPEILDRVAEMRELPVEDGAQALGPDDEVAGAEVAVHEGGRSRRQVRGALGEPAQPELEGRVRLAEHVDDAAVLVDELHRVLRREPGQVGDGHGVDRGRGRVRTAPPSAAGPRRRSRRAAACGGSSRRRCAPSRSRPRGRPRPRGGSTPPGPRRRRVPRRARARTPWTGRWSRSSSRGPAAAPAGRRSRRTGWRRTPRSHATRHPTVG